jgi:hypothetical protein
MRRAKSEVEGMNMRRSLILAVVLGVSLLVGVAAPSASTKFSYTEEIADNGNLVFSFEEGSLKRFASVQYQFDAIGIVSSPNSAMRFEFHESTTSIPDDEGRIAGGFTLNINSSPSPGPCGCGPLTVTYSDMTLTNTATGRGYRIDPITRDFPG